MILRIPACQLRLTKVLRGILFFRQGSADIPFLNQNSNHVRCEGTTADMKNDQSLMGRKLALSFCLLQHCIALRLLSAAEAANRFVNALAFGTRLLPALWRWLAVEIGIPLAAPLAAVRGWDIASLKGGVAGLAPDHALALGVFCRVYVHLLLVLDDNDFYTLQVSPLEPTRHGAYVIHNNSTILK